MDFLAVNGVKIKTPSKFEWSLQDVSGADAGRTDDAIMHKNRKAQKRKISLGWNYPTKEETGAILTAFNPEYINVTYYDPLDCKDVTRTFYVGDRSAPVKIWTVGKQRYTSVTFEIIER